MKNQKGFTLIETIVYLGLFGIIIGGGMVAAYQIIEGTNASQNHMVLQEEADFLMRKIHWALTGITAIGTGPAILSTTKIISGTPVQIIITIDGSVMMLQRDSGTALPLNSNSTIVSNLVFTNIPAQSGKPQGVTTEFTLTTAQHGRPVSQEFSTTKYLRQ